MGKIHFVLVLFVKLVQSNSEKKRGKLFYRLQCNCKWLFRTPKKFVYKLIQLQLNGTIWRRKFLKAAAHCRKNLANLSNGLKMVDFKGTRLDKKTKFGILWVEAANLFLRLNHLYFFRAIATDAVGGGSLTCLLNQEFPVERWKKQPFLLDQGWQVDIKSDLSWVRKRF